MRTAIAIGTVLALSVSQAMAVNNCNSPLNATNLQTQIAGKYACVGTSPNATWNELHMGGASGSIVDYKLGPADPRDPSTQVGTYSITTVSGKGVITYIYTVGGTYAYNVNPISGSSYYFCPTGGGSDLIVTIQSGHC